MLESLKNELDLVQLINSLKAENKCRDILHNN